MTGATEPAHSLWEIARFSERTSHFENGLPVRVSIDPYWRWYCTCTAVSGKQSSEEAAFTGYLAHKAANTETTKE